MNEPIQDINPLLPADLIKAVIVSKFKEHPARGLSSHLENSVP